MKDKQNLADKDPHAVALGRRGGKIGGKVRAKRLTPSRRSEIASKAATARWRKNAAKSEQTPEPLKRNAEDTRQSILEAAHREFCEVGLAGARVDRIAKLSGVNKRMLYHYFESKEELFREMLRRNMVQLSNAEAVTPPNLGEALGYWQELMIGNSDWMRLSVWEALNYGAEHIIGEKERRSFWQMTVEEIRREQAAGKINHEMDADFLQLCLFALVAFPIVLPQMTKLITGHAPDDPKFLRRQKKFLRQFSKLLYPDDEG